MVSQVQSAENQNRLSESPGACNNLGPLNIMLKRLLLSLGAAARVFLQQICTFAAPQSGQSKACSEDRTQCWLYLPQAGGPAHVIKGWLEMKGRIVAICNLPLECEKASWGIFQHTFAALATTCLPQDVI